MLWNETNSLKRSITMEPRSWLLKVALIHLNPPQNTSFSWIIWHYYHETKTIIFSFCLLNTFDVLYIFWCNKRILSLSKVMLIPMILIDTNSYSSNYSIFVNTTTKSIDDGMKQFMRIYVCLLKCLWTNYLYEIFYSLTINNFLLYINNVHCTILHWTSKTKNDRIKLWSL